MMNYSDASAARAGFPPGQRTLQVSLFGVQARPLESLISKKDGSVRPGDFVRLDNLRPKENTEGLLECTIVDDQLFANKKYVTLIPKKEGKKSLAIQKLLESVPVFTSSSSLEY
jgi:hypothetical protein